MQIYIQRNNERFGPYSREAVLEYLKQGIFKAGDPACYAGMSEWKTVSAVLGIPADPPQGRATVAVPGGTGQGRRPGRMRRSSIAPKSDAKNMMIVLNVVLIMIVVAAAYIRWGSGAQGIRQSIAETLAGMLPAPANPNTAGGLSQAPAPLTPVVGSAPVATAKATPPAVAAATPAAPKPFSIADLAGNPDAWPKTVKLKQEVAFPAMFNSQVVGSVTVPAGSAVKLLNVQGDQLLVDYQGGTQKVPWTMTDIEEEARSVSAPPGGQPVTEATAGTNGQPAWKQ